MKETSDRAASLLLSRSLRRAFCDALDAIDELKVTAFDAMASGVMAPESYHPLIDLLNRIWDELRDAFDRTPQVESEDFEI